jgi:malate permease and related proteins
MFAILIQLLPIFVFFALGILLRRVGIADRGHADFLLRFVFFVSLPLLILVSVSALTFTVDKAVLPFLNIGVNLGCFGLTLLVGKLRQLDRKTIGTMLVCTTIVNNSFMFPFVLAVYGQEGFADAILWDFGNAIMMATFVYALAFRYGGETQQGWGMLLRILKAPLIWSLVISVVLSLTNTPIPARLLDIINPLAQMMAPLILIALGMHTSLKISRAGLAFATIGIRMVFGLFCGVLLATLAGLEGTTFKVVALCSGAPIGFNALTLCSMSKLDTELGASSVSLSIIAGLVWIPLLILLLEAVV